MANIQDARGFWTNENPQSFKYTSFGTAAGTVTISNVPAILHSIVVTNRAANGTIIMYDSVGTSTAVIGTITMGTNQSADPPPPYVFDAQTITALTISNSANSHGVILSLP